MIIDPDAKKFLLTILNKNDLSTAFCTIEKAGCNGFKYKLAFVEKDKLLENVVEIRLADGFSIFYSAEFKEIFKDTLVQLKVNGLNKELAFINLSAVATCGCGLSFAVKE